MNKFISNLTASNKSIKEARAKVISEDAIDAQQELVRELKKEKRELDRRLMQLSDMSPDSELSLKVVKDTFKASEWAKEIQAIKIELANKSIEIKLAEETFKEWFEDVQEA
jgi:membrane glycosyltransferase